jgi:hypothetical protein
MSTVEMVKAFEERLVRRVLDGRVVPFVGAGISISARVRGRSDFIPSVGWLEEKVGKELERRLADLEHDLKDQLKSIIDNPSSASKEYKLSKLDQKADLLTWLAGASHLCKVLQIQAFAQLAPQPAHRFLAYFAREGLITEIITTNYDTCIEQAFWASFGSNSDERREASTPKPLAVIFNLAHYREHAGRSRTPSGDPVLHVYKINGDAEDYQAAVKEFERNGNPQLLEERAARIIVTERQLQTFRDEMWARDLYADRARSRSLLFCGFGSDDPQVRHHTMLLMEEMQRQSHPVGEWHEISKLPNAPFFAVYDKHLSFNQLQVLAGFAMANARLGTPADGTAVLKAAYANAFLGSFSKVLEPPSQDGKSEESKLPADLFFERLFQAVWLERVKEELQTGRVLHGWLRSIVCEHRAWCDWLVERIAATSVASSIRDPDNAAPEVLWALFGIMRFLFARTDTPTIFMTWVHAVHTAGGPLQQGSDFYLPLREDPLLILLLLILLLWIVEPNAKDGAWIRHIGPEPGLGLRVPFGSVSGAERVVYLAREGTRAAPLRWSERIPDQVWLLEIPGNERFVPAQDPPVITEPLVREAPVRPVSILRQTAAAVVRAARTPEADPFEIFTKVFAATSPEEGL